MKLKQKGTSVPTLEKAQSVIDENVSEHLIAQAIEVMFKEFERYIKIMNMFKGVDWTIYVKMRNKAGDQANDEVDLLDEEDEEEPKVEGAVPIEQIINDHVAEEEKKSEAQTEEERKAEEEKFREEQEE